MQQHDDHEAMTPVEVYQRGARIVNEAARLRAAQRYFQRAGHHPVVHPPAPARGSVFLQELANETGDARGEADPWAVGASIGMSRAETGRLIRTLNQRGWITESTGNRVALTPRGRELVSR